MRYVTLLLSGVPQNVPLIKLSCSLDRLFDTDEIGTFQLRDLSNDNGKRLIALDFRSGFDAIAAQERLDGYHYEMPNGREYTLSAKITRKKEFLRTRSQSPEYWPETGSPVKEAWAAMALVPTVSDGTMFRAHAKLDAQLELLKKQKLILQTEREVLREKKKLKRDYSRESIIDSDEETPTKRRHRSSSRESSRSRGRSNSRELNLYTKSSRSRKLMIRSRSRQSKLLAIKSSSMEPESKLRELRSRSRDRGLRSSKDSGSKSRELRSRSRDRGLRFSKDSGSKSRELRSRSRDRGLRSSKDSGSKSRELRSRSRDRGLRFSKDSGSKSRELRSRSRDRGLRSSKDSGSKSRELRSRSRDRGLRSSKDSGSKSRELRSRSRSRDRGLRSSKDSGSKSRELRSRSRDQSLRSFKDSGSKSRELRSRSRDRGRSRDCGKNRPRTRDRDLNGWSPSTSRERVSRKRRSRSRDHASDNYKMKAYSPPSPWEWDIIGRSSQERRSRGDRKSRSRELDHSSILRSREPSVRPLAILPKSPVRCPSPNERNTCVRSALDCADGDVIASRHRKIGDTRNDYDEDCYYMRSFCDEPPRGTTDIIKATSSPEISKNCIKTSDTTANKEERVAEDGTKQITIYIDVIPKKAAESDKNKTTESDKKPTAESDINKIGNHSNVETNLSTDQIVSVSANEIENKSTDAKENTKVTNKKKCNVNTKPNETEKERKLIFNLIMPRMLGLVNEIPKRKKDCLSKTRRKRLNIKLKAVVQDRIAALAVNESATDHEVLLRYRQLYTKEDDILLIEKLFDEIIPPEIYSSAGTAGQVTESTITKEIERPVDGVTPNAHNNTVNTVNNGPDYIVCNTTEVIEILDSDLGDPKTPHLDCRDKSVDSAACSIACDEMIDNLVPVTVIDLTLYGNKYTKKGLVPKRPQFVLVVQKLLKQLKQSINKAATKLNQPFPNLQFTNVLKSTLKDIVMGKGYMTTTEIVKSFREKHPKDKDDEFVAKAMEEIKTGKYGAYIEVFNDDADDVVLIEKKYDVVTVLDSDDEQDELLEKIDNLIKEEPIKGEKQCIKREAAQATLQSQDKTSTDVINNSQAPLVTSEAPQVETNDSVSKDLTVKQELPSLPNLIEQYGVTDTETTSNDASNNNETLVENLNNEIKTELTDVAVENLLDSLKNIDGLDAGQITTETETPRVTSITIMTSYSELCSLKYNNGNNSKQVNEIKRENDMDKENNDNGNEKTLNNKSTDATVGSLLEKINETVDKYSEIAAPVIEGIDDVAKTTVKNEPQEEEESIESIIKYVESFCSGLS